MNNWEKIIEYLHYEENNICDDCLSKVLNIKPRQQVNQICNKLKNKIPLQRFKSECSNCKCIKSVNCFIGDKTGNSNIINKNSNVGHKENCCSKLNEYKMFKFEFEEVQIKFKDIEIENIFSKYNKHLLKDILIKPKYNKFKEYISEKYSYYLNTNVNEFLMELKIKNISDYKLFLNSYGDLKYCRFKIDSSNVVNKKGIYIYKIENEIVYVGRCLDNFEKRINAGYANISPKNCYLDGQSTNCRINNLINNNRSKIKLFILKIEDNEAIKKLEIELINQYKPVWNIQGV